MKMIFSGIVIPISTIDWYGRSVSVIFFNGCNFKCLYCSNNNFIKVANQRIEPLYKGGSVMEIEEIEKKILDAKSFISAVVFSGGEPTTQYDALEHLARFAKEQGLLVGVETNGYYPERLSRLIEKKLLDKIFLDIKAPLDDVQKYSYITGRDDAAGRASKSLELENVDIEVRTTVFRPFSEVLGIASALVGRECIYVIQQGIPENAPEGEIRKEKVLTRDEMIVLARSVSFLKNVRIRTKERGEEKIV
ncbi:MAG: ribonucleoside-triphosphate reductase activating protein [Candidatus Methanoperedens nitroreducens]|uniref:Ribonucleoside-triphosphate reductase activating protein n=1 Tax=Candidatus Methanoperedens nitratireducens TaxID=1392998 RepID=A0A0P7ZKP5_9EURY|nr:anaerobic ribonucleoside-triphosphate reductase activating protein [Candidatus Methanoperedens sp. BLZ2]KPQ44641.1 MAG: ribonucleoside-triphosphate reductase activating protein [Candidatus Methanoperedens sp. BLZ1]